MNVNSTKTGTYTGNGTSQSIDLGFRPIKVETINYTDGDSVCIHYDGMTAAASIAIGAAAAASANSITINDRGFSVGSSANVNENAKTFRYIAFAN